MNESTTWATAFLLGSSLALAAPANSQTLLVSPPGMYPESSGTRAYSPYLGGYQEQRAQLLDGNFGGQPRLLKSLSLRRDTDPGYAMTGRSWRQVTLSLASGRYADFGGNFSHNLRSAPVQLFSGSMTWSVPQGLSTRPAPFGADGMHLPFRTPYSHDGRRDLIADLRFAGGSRSDGQTWPKGSLLPYYLDGISVVDFHSSTNHNLGLPACTDTAQVRAATQKLFLRSYGPGTGTLANQIYHYQEVFHAAPSATVVQAIGLPMPAALPATSCIGLHILPLAIFRAQTDVHGYLRTSLGTAAYQPGLVGVRLAAQTAWTDSQSGALKLSNGAVAQIVAQPPGSAIRSASTVSTSELQPLLSSQGLQLGRQYLPILAWGL